VNVAIGVVTFNGADHLVRCLDSLLAQTCAPFEIAIVDNASTDKTRRIIQDFSAARSNGGPSVWYHFNPSNRGFTSAANQILRRATHADNQAEIVILINQDAYLDSECVAALVREFGREPTLAAAGPKILYPDSGAIQFAGGEIREPRGVGLHTGHHETDEGQYDDPKETGYVTGAVMALRVDSLEEVGLFDEVFSPGYYEDVDLCVRLRRHDWNVRYIPSARAWHYESSVFSDRGLRLRLAHRNRLIFLFPRLIDPKFCQQFLRAEIDAIENTLVPDELRALAEASLELLARLRHFTSARLTGPSGSAHSRLAGLLKRVRHEAIDRLIGISR